MSEQRGTVSLPTHLLMEEVERLVRQGHTVTLTVRGNSMLPLVRSGDRAVLAPIETGALRSGMVVLARTTRQQVVLHRIIDCGNGTATGNITLQGDGNIGLTERAIPGRVIAIMTHVVRQGKTRACNSARWRFASALWQLLRPLRRPLLGIYRRVLTK